MSLSDKLNALVREHAKFDPAVASEVKDAATVEAAPQASPYYRDLQERAQRAGKTVAQIRDEDRELLANSRFPAVDCLKPDEVALAAMKLPLPASRLNHHRDCLYCQSIVATSRPPEHLVVEMSRLLADPPREPALAPEPSLNPTPAWSAWSAFWQACLGRLERSQAVFACVGCFLIGVTGTFFARSTVMQGKWVRVTEIDHVLALKNDKLKSLDLKIDETTSAMLAALAKAAEAGDKATQTTPFPSSFEIDIHSNAVVSLSAKTDETVSFFVSEFQKAPNDPAFEPNIKILWRMGQQAKTWNDAKKVLSALDVMKDGTSNTVMLELSDKAFDDVAFRCKMKWPVAFTSHAWDGPTGGPPPILSPK